MSDFALGSADHPLRVAVIGSGPSGFYAAESLFRKRDLHVHVDVFDRLPTPYGLVRYGVAPDHQKIKSVIKAYAKTAAHPHFRFFGNVQLGRDVTVEDLRACYHQIVYAMGSETDRNLGVPGEELEGSHSATAFVAWYNGHPDYRDCAFDLSAERVAVFGVGNVAIDVARILIRNPDELASTDITGYALEALRESRVREVFLYGRRGAAQAAFSPKEIEEIGELEGADLVVDRADLELDPEDEASLEHDTNARKNVAYLRAQLARGGSNERKVHLKFLASPTMIAGESGRVTGVTVERNRLVHLEDGWSRAEGTGDTEHVPVGLVFRAIGYRGVPVPGVPFNERKGIVLNVDGRVIGKDGDPLPGEYVVGWAKRGPTGLIGTNRGCSAGTVAHMVEDLETSAPGNLQNIETVLKSRDVRWVSFDDWLVLDRIEEKRGQAEGKVRDKVVGSEEMLALVSANENAPRP